MTPDLTYSCDVYMWDVCVCVAGVCWLCCAGCGRHGAPVVKVRVLWVSCVSVSQALSCVFRTLPLDPLKGRQRFVQHITKAGGAPEGWGGGLTMMP